MSDFLRQLFAASAKPEVNPYLRALIPQTQMEREPLAPMSPMATAAMAAPGVGEAMAVAQSFQQPLPRSVPEWWERVQAQGQAMMDPRNLVLMAAIRAGKLPPSMAGEPGYRYHVTNTERAFDIARSGRVKTHKPWKYTDQGAWPDRTTEPRSYWSEKPLGDFAPEEGVPTAIRVRADAAPFVRESTGDWFLRKPLRTAAVEVLGEDGQWHPISELLDKPAPAGSGQPKR